MPKFLVSLRALTAKDATVVVEAPDADSIDLKEVYCAYDDTGWEDSEDWDPGEHQIERLATDEDGAVQMRIDEDGYPVEVDNNPEPTVKPSAWDVDPDYPVEDWQYEVANDDTRQGYQDWASSKREED